MPQAATILLIESHDDTRDLSAACLRHDGFTVVEAATTDEGVPHVASVDAIITGIGVGGSMDGLELIRRVRQHDATARTPIIVVTAYAFDAYREQARAAGCDVFLTKPCPPDALRGELRRLLAAARVPAPPSAPIPPRQKRRHRRS